MNVVALLSGAVDRSDARMHLADVRVGVIVRLVSVMVTYVAAFLFLSGIGLLAAGYSDMARAMVPVTGAATYPVSLLTLACAGLVCGALWVSSTVWLRAIMTTRRVGLAVAIVGLSYLAALVTLWASWIFDLDDKWVYLRTARNVLAYGLPYWNPEDRLNVQASFIWPYLTAPGILVGDWDLFARGVGIASLLLTSIVIALQIRDILLRAVAAAAVILFLPLLLWSIGGLETAFATLVLIVAATCVFRRGLGSPLPWLLFGSLMFVRPDLILVGAGAGAVYGLFGDGRLGRRFLIGCVLVAPVAAFILMSLAFFDLPLPRPFYVKGWNKAFSGSYPLYFDLSVGLSHLLSALSLSMVWVTLLGFFGWRLVRQGRGAWRLDELALTVGALVHLAYVVAGGYQHMNYAFRYYIPSMVMLLLVAVIHFDRAITAGTVKPGSMLMGALVWGSLFVQLPFFSWTAYHAYWHEMALTFSPLRDRFSVHSYATYMQTWLAGGEYLKQVERPGDRLFLWADLAGAAMTDIYLMDQYYAPPTLSSFPEVRDCTTLLHCYRVYDYVLVEPNPPNPNMTRELTTHLVDRRYDNLWILKRATRVVDDASGVSVQPSVASVQLAGVRATGEWAAPVDGSPGVRLVPRPDETASFEFQLDGLANRSTVVVAATIRAEPNRASLTRLILEGGRPADRPIADELVGDGAWARIAAAVEDGQWPDGVATLHLQAGDVATSAPLEVSEVRVVVDGATALVLDGQQLAELAR